MEKVSLGNDRAECVNSSSVSTKTEGVLRSTADLATSVVRIDWDEVFGRSSEGSSMIEEKVSSNIERN